MAEYVNQCMQLPLICIIKRRVQLTFLEASQRFDRARKLPERLCVACVDCCIQ